MGATMRLGQEVELARSSSDFSPAMMAAPHKRRGISTDQTSHPTAVAALLIQHLTCFKIAMSGFRPCTHIGGGREESTCWSWELANSLLYCPSTH